MVCNVEDAQAHKFLSADSQCVFILGAPRSGTTILSHCLRKLGWGGYDEGHIFDTLVAFFKSIETKETIYLTEHKNTDWAAEHFPYITLQMNLIEFFQNFMTTHFGVRWHDKTPGSEAVIIAPALKKIFPNAKFIFCRRRGFDVMGSAMRRFSLDEAGLKATCDEWVETMMHWAKVRKELYACAIEIEHSELVSNPAGVAQALIAFLELPEDQVEPVRRLLRNDHPEQTALDNDIIMLENFLLSEESSAYILSNIAYCMRFYGYGLNTLHETGVSRRMIAFTNDPEYVDLSRLSDSNFYKYTGKDRFLLHPGSRDAPRSRIVFLSEDVAGARVVSAWLKLENEKAAPVRGGIALYRDGVRIGADEGVCEWRKDTLLVVNIPEETPNLAIEVWTEMADPRQSNDYAWANFIDLSIF